MDISAQYRQLLSSSSQLELLGQQNSIAGFVATLKQLWSCSLSDQQLLAALQRENLQAQPLGAEQMAGNWFASGYYKQAIHWCAPVGVASQAFQDQYISQCQQRLLNQFVRPRTALQTLLSERGNSAEPVSPPAGFIFHLSRCGSTLISGCLSEVATANVMSEPPVITELLLDASITRAEQLAAIQQVLHAQRLAMPAQPHLVIKWNAWDLLRWQDIRTTWPEVPVVLLVRHPLEILASHERQAGRHMAGDPSMANFHPVFANTYPVHDQDGRFGLLARRVAVLSELMAQMQLMATESKVMLVDYAGLDAQKIRQVIDFFRLPVTAENEASVCQRMQFHSKEPARKFQEDSARKRELFAPEQRRYIVDKLDGQYQQLLNCLR